MKKIETNNVSEIEYCTSNGVVSNIFVRRGITEKQTEIEDENGERVSARVFEFEELSSAVNIRDYSSLVERTIAMVYSVSAELAIQRQRDTKPDEWSEYNRFCEAVKRAAREVIG